MMEFCSDSPVKKKKKTHNQDGNKECIIHIREANANESVSSFTERSWKTAKTASLLRSDELLTSFTDIPDNNKCGYHSKCYASYTNKKSLTKFEQTSNVEDQRKSKRRTDSTGSALAPQICVICREKKTSKDNTGYEKIVKCVTLSSAGMLRNYALDSDDQVLKKDVLFYSHEEIIAKEFQYHRSCYRHISRKPKELSVGRNEAKESFAEVTKFIDEFVIKNGQVVKISNLALIYNNCIKSKNLAITTTENRHLKSRLTNHYGEKLLFFQRKPGTPELVYSADSCNDINTDDSSFFLLDDVQKIRKCALMIKEEIIGAGSFFSSWPPKAKEIKSDNIKIPKLLETFLLSLLTKDAVPSSRVQRLVKSIGQDLMYTATSGKIKTVKHLELGVFLKRKTGSKLLVNCLNRLGHSISYDEVNLIETRFAELQINQESQREYVPYNMKPFVFTTYVYDNCDHNAETLCGEVMHCTNGIMVQPASARSILETISNAQPATSLSKRRSFQAVTLELEPYYEPKEKVGPKPLGAIERNESQMDEFFCKQSDLLWIFARYVCSKAYDKQQVAGWSGFHHLSSHKNEFAPHTISYLPAINKSPTKMDTVLEILLQVKAKSEALGLKYADLVMDHAIYAKALEILTNPAQSDLNKFVNLRMGGFHASCIFIAVIGKRFSSAGLKDLLIESNVLGPSTVDSVLNGKQYNRAMRALKTVYEALQRLKVDAFEYWLSLNGKLQKLSSFKASLELHNLIKECTNQNYQSTLSTFEDLFALFEEFDNEIDKGRLGPMAVFWNSFVQMIQLLFDYIKSMRIGDWDLHLACMERMLPWIHAYDRINYMRTFTYCWASQKKLPETFPEIYQEFKHGYFSIKRTDGNFNMLPPDQVIEQTINKEQKGPGGIIGVTTSIGTVQRWVLASHETAALATDFKSSLGLHSEGSQPKDIGPKRQDFDESQVQSCYDLISHWNNPWNNSDSLVNMSSGTVANSEIQSDLLNAQEVGKESVEQFVKLRIESDEVSFNHPVKKLNLKTFEACGNRKVVKVKGMNVAIKSERETFARLLTIQQQRGINLQEVLEYELSAVPLSLANPDGSLNKTQKSKLIHILEPDIPVIEPSLNTPTIYDGMVLLQKLPVALVTFGDISDYLLKKVMKTASRVVYFVTDNYLPNSIKSMERVKRSISGTLRVKAIRRDQEKPKQMKKYLSNTENKIDLVKFLLNDWSHNLQNATLLDNKELFLTVEEHAYSITSTNGQLNTKPVRELQSTQEEADTKMFLCALHASEMGFGGIKIVTVDTDVLVLALYYQLILPISLFIEIGSSSKAKIFDIKSNTLLPSVSNILPSFHALTGCDSTSSFNGIGKGKALATIKVDDRYIDAAALLGEHKTIPHTVKEVLEEYVCRLYGEKHEICINKTRYKIFTSMKELPSPNRLPPCKDSLYLHFDRVNHQLYEWKRALDHQYMFVDPVGNGWCTKNGCLEIQWSNKLPAPVSILKFTACQCKKNKCITGLCSCFKHGLKCSPVCNCCSCKNCFQTGDESESEIDTNDDNDHDESDFYDND